MGRRKAKIVEQISITGIADRGKSVGRSPSGEVFFVEGAVPGDFIDAIIFKKKKGVGQGNIQNLLIPSPYRVDPFCDHFSLCGGCKWQHLDYNTQLKEKEKNVFAAFERLAKIIPNNCLPIIGAEENRFYRNKMEYTFATRRWVPQSELDTKKEISFGPASGFHRAGSFDKVVEVERCHLQEDYGNQIRNFINQYLLDNNLSYFNIRENHGFMRNLIMRNNRKNQWMVNLIFGENNPEAIKEILNSVQKQFDQISNLWYTINEKKNDTIVDLPVNHYYGDQYLSEYLGEVQFNIGPKSFFQTNTFQAERLFTAAMQIAELNGSENVYDLYTGLGSIALFISKYCKQVVGIEEIPEAIEDAKENMKLNNITNARFYAGDVKDILTQKFEQEHGAADLIITDPPRIGMHEKVIKMLLQYEAPKILYISCNPSTQARDVQLLSVKYDLETIQPVDMFPHTHHIENIALLKLRNE